MPHLHLPAAHSDADLALAADVAAAVGSSDLYVAWSHAEGAGVVPEIEALIREQRTGNPVGGIFVAMARGFAALWDAIVHGSADRAQLEAPRADAPRRTAEPSA